MRCLAYSSRILTGGRTFYGGSNSAGPACNWRSSESVIGSTASSGSTFSPAPAGQGSKGYPTLSSGHSTGVDAASRVSGLVVGAHVSGGV